MTKKISLILTMMAAVLVMTTGVASAAAPNCSVGGNKTAYNAGVKAGKSIVKQAWNGIGQDPTQFDTFADTVRDIVHAQIATVPTSATDAVKCRAQGLAQGVCDQLGIIQTQVGNVCLLDGQTWGLFAAQLYCDLSTAFGGLAVDGYLLNPPDGLCGTQFELGCDGTFASFATTPANACALFTSGEFEAVYDESRANMCVYEF